MLPSSDGHFAGMAKSGVEVAWVTSTPPAVYVPGEEWKYPLKVISAAGGLRYQVFGPVGMAADANGVVTWNVPPGANLDAKVTIHVFDAKDNRAVHVFWMTKK